MMYYSSVIKIKEVVISMLVTMKEILEEAEKNKSAIGCINTPNMETLRGIIAAAEELNTPIIIDHAQVHDSLIPVEKIGPYMVEHAKKSKVPVCVHVDRRSRVRCDAKW